VPAAPHEIDTFDASRTRSGPGLGDLFANRYRIDRCLGRGSMGVVYAAHDSVVDEDIALKLLSLPLSDAQERFGREVRLARRVTHRNAARTFDLGEFAGVHFITMELVEGESLRVLLARQNRLEPSQAMELGRQLCLGLAAAHAVGVIHRDLKPANIMVDTSGRVVITDFGVACTSMEEAGVMAKRPPLAGTPLYMAPEQVVGAPLDARADLYAVGVILYEMLTGQGPFTGQTQVEIAMARLSMPPPDPRKLVAVPDALAELVVRCLAQVPNDRPASAEAIALELTELRVAAPGLPAAPAPGSTRASTTNTSMFVSAELGDRALAVMPFRYRGPEDEEYLAEVLTDELVDLLAMTRGLRVSASGATSQFRNERDARTIGRALGVEAIIDGSLQRSHDQIRIVARVIDVETGFQRWSERFEGRLEDVFELQDRMAKRVVEGLRLELSIQGQRRIVAGDAVELYLRGRQRAREADISGQTLEEAIGLYERALERAPCFPLALAARADAAVQRWFLPSSRVTGDWAEISRAAVLAALDGAPDLAESQLAAARLHVNHGELTTAARHLMTALENAPTCAAAHEYLGILQCDAGRSAEGVRHILLAHELDPALHQGAFSVLRHYALRGDEAAYEAQLSRIKRSPSSLPFVLSLFEFRIALWRDDQARARGVQWRTTGVEQGVSGVLQRALDRELSDERIAAGFDEFIDKQSSPRLRTVFRQIAVEILAWRGAHALALAQLTRAAQTGVLLDADWCEACPVLAPLRSDPVFIATQEGVRARADAIWRTGA
jgi:serine/threonine-protein kinase